MDPSSLIFVVIIAIWAAYLLGHWVRRRDQLATARSIDRFSDAMRVLERRAPVPAVPAGLSRAYVMAPVRPLTFEPPARTSVRVLAQPRGARVRRARILAALVAATPAGLLLVALTALPWWVAAVPTLALVGLVARLRSTARRQRQRRQRHATVQRRAAARAGRESVRSVVGQVVAARGERLAESTQRAAARLAQPVQAVQQAVQPGVEPAPAENGWQPVPVPPPTYTLKPKATPVLRPQAPAQPAPAPPATAQPATSPEPQVAAAPQPQPVVAFDLDEILERRIASGA